MTLEQIHDLLVSEEADEFEIQMIEAALASPTMTEEEVEEFLERMKLGSTRLAAHILNCASGPRYGPWCQRSGVAGTPRELKGRG